MGTHRIWLEEAVVGDCADDLPELVIDGEEARHAVRVKRLSEGDLLEALDGAGSRVTARIDAVDKIRGDWRLVARAVGIERVTPVSPRVEVWTATPKGNRLEGMVDQLSQIGAAMWRPLVTAWTTVDPREGKLSRLERTVRESAKQCGRAWVMEIGAQTTFGASLSAGEGTRVVVADGSGERYAGSEERIRLLVGPEGGWTSDELEEARASGVSVCSFGVHAMRLETAAVVAAGIVVRG